MKLTPHFVKIRVAVIKKQPTGNIYNGDFPHRCWMRVDGHFIDVEENGGPGHELMLETRRHEFGFTPDQEEHAKNYYESGAFMNPKKPLDKKTLSLLKTDPQARRDLYQENFPNTEKFSRDWANVQGSPQDLHFIFPYEPDSRWWNLVEDIIMKFPQISKMTFIYEKAGLVTSLDRNHFLSLNSWQQVWNPPKTRSFLQKFF